MTLGLRPGALEGPQVPAPGPRCVPAVSLQGCYSWHNERAEGGKVMSCCHLRCLERWDLLAGQSEGL